MQWLTITALAFLIPALAPQLSQALSSAPLPEGFTLVQGWSAILVPGALLLSGIFGYRLAVSMFLESARLWRSVAWLTFAALLNCVLVYYCTSTVVRPLLLDRAWIWPALWLGLATIFGMLTILNVAFSLPTPTGANPAKEKRVTHANGVQWQNVASPHEDRFCTECGGRLESGSCLKCITPARVEANI